ncbi:hypothetical protein OB919_16435 [Halobacteria archaeon AArc-curdl1]|uniref:Uncharacterized protein n=1 Tax=Natronosalvus hydrolyticus TaxID=2979988 RepID=A0AAP3E842_9EURY|nr:hypothetical protein [Halobacteria archaeon AArc-curdl1]
MDPFAALAQVTGGDIEPATGGMLAYLGTFLVTTLFYGITLHIAARYVLEYVSIKRAFTVAPVLAAVLLLLQQWGPLIVVPFTVTLAYALILVVYDLSYKLAALVALIYYTVAVIVGFTIFNIWFLLGTAPG